MTDKDTEEMKVTIDLDTEVVELNEANQEALNIVHEYKTLSFNAGPTNIITPNENIQLREVSIHPAVGRDRVFDYPERLRVDIEYEQLAHLHFVDPSMAAKGIPQWKCTSKYAAVYSVFLVTPNHIHILVHDLLTAENGIEDAHEYYTPDDVETYLFYAKEFREAYKPD